MMSESQRESEETLGERLRVQLGEEHTVERELGGGGMSRVFLVHDDTLDRRIVAKVLSGASGMSADRFRREMLLSASLQHPHIVPIIAAGDVDGVPWYSMPYIEGRSLRDRMSSGVDLPTRDALRILRDIARACSFAHEKGIVHRDLKPENVMLTGDAAVIIDFGIAKAIAAANEVTPSPDTDPASLTRIGFTVGTPTYMAPEQSAGDPGLDHRADLYSFGIVAFELLAGQPPFSGATSQELLKAHLADPVPPLAKFRSDVPAGVEAVITHCLAKMPNDRPASAAEVVDRLEELLAGETVERPAHALGSSWTLRGLVAATIAAVVLVGAWLSRPEPVEARLPSSVAVLPFVPRGTDSLSQWLAVGLGDDVAAQLTALGGVQVASRLSVESVGRAAVKPEVLAEMLGVRTLLDGVVRRKGDKLRVIAQLVDAGSGEVLWSGVYNQRPDSAGAMVDDIVSGVRSVLVAIPATDEPTASRANRDPVAYSDYLRGRALVATRRDDDLAEGVRALERAVEADPTFAAAHAALADALMLLPLYRGVPVADIIVEVTESLDRALTLEPDLPAALMTRATVNVLNHRWAEAESDLEAALRVAPSAEAVKRLGELLLVTGRHELARLSFARSVELDPARPLPIVLGGIAAVMSGDRRDALVAFDTAIAMDSINGAVHFLAGAGLLMLGDSQRARTELETALRLAPDQPLLRGVYAQALAAGGDLPAATQLRDGLASDRLRSGVAGGLAHAQLAVGDTAAALDALEDALRERDPIFGAEPLMSPLMAALHDSPRFQAILRQAGLTEGSR
jgi:TolB-like protein/tetratricopeptide (TPR) repeat protein/predicted Ser/Thr protein kinase